MGFLRFAPLLLVSALPAGAMEVLHLKNGRQIVVDHYWEEGEQILYEKNGSTFGFPRELLDRVDRLDPLPASEDGGEGTGFRNAVATESIEAARKSAREGDLDEATLQYRKALETEPESVATRLELGTLYLTRGDLSAAQSQLEQAKRISPEDARVRETLGDVYYRMGRTPLAIREWQAVISTSPSPGVLYKLKKALRENNEDIAFEERGDHARFLLRYDGSVNEVIGRIVTAALEEEYYELASELRFAPRAPVTATLYTNQEFFDVTLAPTWASGLNDGEIRIPVEGVTEMTPKLRRVLRHELTHSFVNALTAGNCPSWFHEGIAQLREGGERSDPYPRVKAALAEGSLLPLWSLEGPLLDYSKEKALLAYAEALAATEYLAMRRGRPALIRILHLLGERQTMNEALKEVVGLDYQEFQTAWEADLARYPSRGNQ